MRDEMLGADFVRARDEAAHDAIDNYNAWPDDDRPTRAEAERDAALADREYQKRNPSCP